MQYWAILKKLEQLSLQARAVFYNANSPWFKVVNDVLAAVTIIAVLSIVLETVPSFAPYIHFFRIVEYIAVIIFTLEYIGRVIANKGHIKKYVFGYFGIIDLLSIVPTYLALTNVLFFKSVRVVRILRLLRMIRIAKLARSTEHAPIDPEEHAHIYKLSVRIYFLALIASVTIFGTLMYVVEGSRPEFASIPLSMLWAAKVSLGGVAQHMPTTSLGDLVTIAARFSGLALFGLMVSIIGGSLRWILFGTQDVDFPTAPHESSLSVMHGESRDS